MRLRTFYWLIFLFVPLIILVIQLGPLVFSDEDPPPTPAERVAAMRKSCAEERAKLGNWASGKKLGSAAKAQFLLAIRLDHDVRRARQRLGHKKDGEGGWKAGRKKDWEYGRGAMEKHGKELVDREADVLAAESKAFEELGLALISEGEQDLGRELCFRAHLLSPLSEKAAEGTGLVRFAKGYVTPDISKALREIPEVEKVQMKGFLGSTLGIRTEIRRCGAALAETVGNGNAAGDLAKLGHRATLLVTKRLGIHTRPLGWIQLIVTNGPEQFNSFLDRAGVFQEPRLSNMKRLGTARAYRPRHFAASYVGGMGDPTNRAPLFIHTAAEDVLTFQTGKQPPAWLAEAVGVDANLILTGRPGPLCVVFEQSSGLNLKERLEKPADWPRQLLRQAVLGTLPRLPNLLRAQFQALSPDDVIAAREYYRFLILTHREGFAVFLKQLSENVEPEPAFREGFGRSVEEAEAEFIRALTGGK